MICGQCGKTIWAAEGEPCICSCQKRAQTTLRNEQTRISLSPSIAKQDKAMARLLKRAADRVKKMTPEEREAMDKAQRKSWTEQDND